STVGRGGRGIPIVFATGNNNRLIDSFPLHNHPYVINVASVERIDCRDGRSGYGDHIDVCAVGYGNASLGPFGVTGINTDDGAYLGGTSAAAPQVAGALALALSVNSDLTRDQLVTLLHESSDHIQYPIDWTQDRDGDGVKDFSQHYGYGRLNIRRLAML